MKYKLTLRYSGDDGYGYGGKAKTTINKSFNILEEAHEYIKEHPYAEFYTGFEVQTKLKLTNYFIIKETEVERKEI